MLDYFGQQRATLRADHVLFAFERSMGFGVGEKLLLEQVCLQMGFPTPRPELSMYTIKEVIVVLY